jgi:hypothetical protein
MPSGAGDGAETPAVNVLEGGTRKKEFVGPSVQAFHADMMALYFHRKGKDHEALKWYFFFTPRVHRDPNDLTHDTQLCVFCHTF